jgi:DNA-binding XRE family transcriptional regulator
MSNEENEIRRLENQLVVYLDEMKELLIEKQLFVATLRKVLPAVSPSKTDIEGRNYQSYLVEFLNTTNYIRKLNEQERHHLVVQLQTLVQRFIEYDKVISACLQVLGLDENLENLSELQTHQRFALADSSVAVFAGEFVKIFPNWKGILGKLEKLMIEESPVLEEASKLFDHFSEQEDSPGYGERDPDAPLTSMSHATYHELRSKLVKSKNFQASPDNPWPTLFLTKGGAVGNAQLRPPVIENQPLMPPEEVERWVQIMWKQREELSDLDADALDLLCHTWLQQARRPDSSALAIVDQFLLMRGLKPKQSGQGRRGGFEPEQRRDMLRALSHIQSLWLNMGSVEVYEEETEATEESTSNSKKNRRRRAVKKDIESRAFVVTDRMGQLNMDGYMDVERFIFQPGKLFAQFLFGPGRQTALLSAKAVEYDPYRQRWEKRLARYFSWQWRIQSKHGSYTRPYRVATILEAVEEEINEKRPSSTRERLEKALDILQEDKVIASWQYDRWDEQAAEQRGWAQHWLQATLLVEPPEVIRETYKNIEHQETRRTLHKGKGAASKGAKITEQFQIRNGITISSVSAENISPIGLGKQIQARRKLLHLSQSQVAEQLEIAQSYLSKLENDLVRPAPELEKRIESWLNEED